jgi:hypothetical protein
MPEDGWRLERITRRRRRQNIWGLWTACSLGEGSEGHVVVRGLFGRASTGRNAKANQRGR